MLPQVPIVLQVCGCKGFEELHCIAPGEHTPEQDPATHAWLLQATAVPQCPVASQVCTPFVVLAHCVTPGVHTPVHAPLTQAWFVHPLTGPQLPVDVHVWTPSPEHCVAPGLHATHAPERQELALPEHATGEPHWPAAVHVWTPPFGPEAHWVAPGLQTPVHAPPLQTYVQLEGAPHCPLEPHVSTPLPTHCLLAGVHEPTQVPPLHTLAHGLPVFTQDPAELQVWGCCPLHCIAPGVQLPEHEPPLQT